MDDTIHFPIQYSEGKTYKHPRFSEFIFVHEYWHAIFSTNLRLSSKLSSFKEYERIYFTALKNDEWGQELVKKYDDRLMERARERKQNPQNLELITKLSQEMQALEDLMDVQEVKRNNLMQQIKGSEYSKIPLLAYHEFFADIGAVIHSGAPTTMSSLLNYAGEKQKHHERSFLNRIRIKGWNETESHALFAPARSFVWKYILSTPQFRQNQGPGLQKIFLIIENEIAQSIEHAQQNKFENSEQLNRRLIKSLFEKFHIQ